MTTRSLTALAIRSIGKPVAPARESSEKSPYGTLQTIARRTGSALTRSASCAFVIRVERPGSGSDLPEESACAGNETTMPTSTMKPVRRTSPAKQTGQATPQCPRTFRTAPDQAELPYTGPVRHRRIIRFSSSGVSAQASGMVSRHSPVLGAHAWPPLPLVQSACRTEPGARIARRGHRARTEAGNVVLGGEVLVGAVFPHGGAYSVDKDCLVELRQRLICCACRHPMNSPTAGRGHLDRETLDTSPEAPGLAGFP